MSAVVTTVAKDSLFFDYNDLENLNQERDATPLCGDNNEIAKEINALKTQMAQEHNEYLLEKQLNQKLQSQIKQFNDEKDKNEMEVIQAGYHVEEMTIKVTELESKLKHYELVTQEMMKLGGYGLK